MNKTCQVQERPKNFKEWVKQVLTLRLVLSVSIGAILGFAYYYYVGCASGSCALSSNPYYSTIWGAAMGWFLGSGKSCCSC